MKKTLYIIVLLFFSATLMSCSNNKIQLNDFAEAYIDKGYDVDINEKPLYSFIGASDGFIFYLAGDKVAVYEFDNEKELKKSSFYEKFDLINGRFGLETNSSIAKEIFDKVK